MILIVGPILMALAVLLIVAPRLFGFLMRAVILLVVLCLLYVIDGQREHPFLSHSQSNSVDVR